jgi:hypothetical protein
MEEFLFLGVLDKSNLSSIDITFPPSPTIFDARIV